MTNVRSAHDASEDTFQVDVHEGLFPLDLTSWVDASHLRETVANAAHRSSGGPWMDLLRGVPCPSTPDDRLVLVAYCYLRGVFHSQDVLRQLDSDETLGSMRSQVGLRAEQLRQYRRQSRSALADCLTHALLQLWRERHPDHPQAPYGDSLVWNRHNLGFLQPFYRHAKERLDQAVRLDSMALDD